MHLQHQQHIDKPLMKTPIEEAFKDDEIICLICGKGGMKTLARHLNFIHSVKPGHYRRLFGIKSKRPLTSRNYEQMRREFAKQQGSTDLLLKARAAKAAKLSATDPGPVAETCEGAKRPYKRRHIQAEVPPGI